MILAGGRGSRLHDLTKKVAKPAVSYGGKYRIIDFPLSNCANSGIDVVGVLTQYESVLLNSYAAAGRRWGLDTKDSGVYILPPREKAEQTWTYTEELRMLFLRTLTLLIPMHRNICWFFRVTIFTRWTTMRCLITTKNIMQMQPSPLLRFR